LKLVRPDKCLFCLNGPAYPTRIFETKNIYVIPNKFPAFVLNPQVYNDGNNFYNNQKAFGVHEVIIRKDHDEHLPNIPLPHWLELLWVYQSRLLAYTKEPYFAYGAIFHNHGIEAGSSIAHPHSQFIVSEILPPFIAKEAEHQKVYYERHNTCLICAMIREERQRGIRIVAENRRYLAFMPYASRYPYEIMVAPKKHASRFETEDEISLSHLATILHKVFGLFGSKLKDPPLNFIIHTKPYSPVVEEKNWHWHIEILPRLEHWGGYETGTGLIINALLPEKAAAFLKS